MKRTRGGFTLIELLLVISIIAMLIALLGPMGQMLFRRADDIDCQKHLASVSQAYMAYVHEHRQFPPFVDRAEFLPAGTYTLQLFPSRNFIIADKGSFGAGFGPLIWHDRIPPDYLICPSDKSRYGGPEGWWKIAGGNPVTVKRKVERKDPANETIQTSYSLRAFLYPWTPGTVGSGVRVANEKNYVYGTGGVSAFMACRINTAAAVLARHERGAPVAYLDGSIDFRTDRILWDDNINKMTDGLTASNSIFMMGMWQTLDHRP